MELHEKLQKLMTARPELSYRVLGAMIGSNHGVIERLVNGKTKRPSFRLMADIARVLGVPLDYLADDAQVSPPAPMSPRRVHIEEMIYKLGEEEALDRLGMVSPGRTEAFIPRHRTLGPDGLPTDSPVTPERAPKKTPR